MTHLLSIVEVPVGDSLGVIYLDAGVRRCVQSASVQEIRPSDHSESTAVKLMCLHFFDIEIAKQNSPAVQESARPLQQIVELGCDTAGTLYRQARSCFEVLCVEFFHLGTEDNRRHHGEHQENRREHDSKENDIDLTEQ